MVFVGGRLCWRMLVLENDGVCWRMLVFEDDGVCWWGMVCGVACDR